MALLLPGETNLEAERRLGFDPTRRPRELWRMRDSEIKARSNAWLSSEPLWKPEGRMGPNPAWVGVKVLGEGGNGTAGLWRLLSERPPEGTPGRLPFKTCVVKQQAGRGDMLNESKIYETLKHINSQHLVKMYRRLYEDVGLNTMRGDREGPVYRMYLEHCQQGDVQTMMDEKYDGKKNFEEHEIWNVFHCIARGFYAMHYGHEELGELRWDRDEIVHFDFKANNVFMADPQRDEEHKGALVMKIGDYGHSREVPLEQDLSYNFVHRWRGTRRYKLPEQLRYRQEVIERPWMDKAPKSMHDAGNGNILNNLRYGTPSNVWQLGLIIWQMIHTIEWCEDGDENKPYSKGPPDLQWQDDSKTYPPGRFLLKLYPVSKTWLGVNDEVGGVHTLATQEDINYYNGEYDDIIVDPKKERESSQEERNLDKRSISSENRARAEFRKRRLYSDSLHKLVMDCLIVQQESRIHVDDLYRITEKFKNFYRDQVGPELPPPYAPEPPLGDLPPPWNDTTLRPGEGLGAPVPEHLESRNLDMYELFHANLEHDEAEALRQWAQDNPVADMSQVDILEARALINRNQQDITGYNKAMRQYQGQRNRPKYEVPQPFPKGLVYEYDYQVGGGGGGGRGGRGGRRGGKGGRGGKEDRGGKEGMDPERRKDDQGPGDRPKREERRTHKSGNPKGPKDFSFEASDTPSYLKQGFQSTPEHMKFSLGDKPDKKEGGGGDLGGLRSIKIGSRAGISIRSRTSRKGKDQGKKSAIIWPEFPTGLQKALDEALILQALAIPELKDSIMFCTIIDKKPGEGQDEYKGIIYLENLLPQTTALEIKKMLTEKETGIKVENMKLIGSDRFKFSREFEDEEQRKDIHGVELLYMILQSHRFEVKERWGAWC